MMTAYEYYYSIVAQGVFAGIVAECCRRDHFLIRYPGVFFLVIFVSTPGFFEAVL